MPVHIFFSLFINVSVETIHTMTKKNLNVLIVEDEPDICFLLSSILRQKSLRTSYVNCLSDAKAALRNELPSILFLDNHLPDGLGIDFIPFVRKKYPDIKIIMITAHDTPEDRKRSYENGGDYFIAKPFSRLQINEMLEQVN